MLRRTNQTMQTITPTIKPTYKQHLCYEKLYDKVTLFPGFGGGAGGGKSWLGCEWEITNCYRYPGSKWFIARNELKRIMGSTYQTFRKVCKFHGIPESDWHLDGKYNWIIFKNGSQIDLLDAKYLPSDPMYERFGSLEYTGGWIEEAGEVHFMAFDVLKTRVGRHMNIEFGLTPKLLCTFNPTKAWIYRVFYKPWKDNNMSPEYSFIQALYRDNEFTADSYEKQLNSISDRITKLRLRDGVWEYEDSDTALIEYDAIIDLFSNSIVPSPLKYLTADVARYGSDRVTMGRWRGLDLYKVDIKTKQGIDVTSNQLTKILFEDHIPRSFTVVDDDGVGGGVVDNVRGVKGFVNGSSPIALKDPTKWKAVVKQNYSNLKTQCAYMLAEKINNHEIAITAELSDADKDMLIEELQQIRKKITNDAAKLQIIGKDEVKENIGRSPDISDMMIMRMYFFLDRPVMFVARDPIIGHGGVKPFA